MSSILSELLPYPFEKGMLPYPDQGASTLIWGAHYFEEVEQFGQIDCIQSFKPYARELNLHNINNVPTSPENHKYSTIFCVLPKQKEEALYRLAFSLQCLEENGLLLAVAANDAGGRRLEKWFKDLGLQPASLSKSKCRIVWASKNDIDQAEIEKFIIAGAQQSIQMDGLSFVTKPGIFGWNKIDSGSKLLAQSLPQELKGVGADFGCGYGFLSHFVLDGNKQVKKLYAIDADYNALQCVEKNLQKYTERASINCRWEDLTSIVEDIKSLDWIVMNPPFHEGRDMKSDIGVKFIETAAQSLRQGGKLYMVANAHLPYEKILTQYFSVVEKIVEEQGFKVFLAVK